LKFYKKSIKNNFHNQLLMFVFFGLLNVMLDKNKFKK